MRKADTEKKLTAKKSSQRRVRTRFAPSPTGFLHIGGVRTALFNYIFAKQNKGNFILRIEDTDEERSKPEFEKDIIESLGWMGLKWDEFYKQSERKEIYKKYLEKLLRENKAYYCFCAPEELEAGRQYQISQGIPPHYDGKCSNLSPGEVEERIKQGKKCVIRLKIPSKKVQIHDLIRGRVEFDTSLTGDIVIAKSLTAPLYHFSVVVDDFEMEITHVIRGEEHLSNTPRQIILQEALEFSTPQYAHMPLILAPDRSKLSKRHGAVSLAEYKRQGYLPGALLNFLAFLGWNPGDEKEIYSLPGLIKDFSLEKVQKGGAIFNIKRLDYLNGFYIRQKPINKITELSLPYLAEAKLIRSVVDEQERLIKVNGKAGKKFVHDYVVQETKEKIGLKYLQSIIAIYRERLKKLSEIPELADFFFKEKLQYDKSLLRWKEIGESGLIFVMEKLEKILGKVEKKDWNAKNLENILLKETGKINSDLNLKTGDRGYVLWPLRVALSGKKFSAGPFQIAEVLGKEKTLKRLKEARGLLNDNCQTRIVKR